MTLGSFAGKVRTHAHRISDSPGNLKRFLSGLRGDAVILSHVDADGLCAATIFKRFLDRRGIAYRHTWPAKGKNAYTEATVKRLRELKPGALIVLDLGIMEEVLVPGVPTLFVDHHRPYGRPKDALIVSSYGEDPAPPTSYVAYDSLCAIDPGLEDIAWLCAVGTTGDVGTDVVFARKECATGQFKRKDIVNAEVLVNSAKRASAYDIETSAGLLGGAGALEDLVRADSPAVAKLSRYRREVNSEVRRCRHEGPNFLWRVAVIPFKSSCDIQGLIAEPWRRRLDKYFVIAANFGYIDGKVAYVVRTQLEASVIDFMESLKPAGHPGHIVFGHDRAGSGIIEREVWEAIAARMGFKDK
jgi:single-stranded-DNA-specific exonuclease